MFETLSSLTTRYREWKIFEGFAMEDLADMLERADVMADFTGF